MSRKKRLFSRLYWPFLFLLWLSVAVVSWYGLHTFRKFSIEQLSRSLESFAHAVERQLPAMLDDSTGALVDSLCKDLGRSAGTRVTVVLPDGRVIGDTDSDPKTMNDHRSRPEIAAALRGEFGSSLRFSHTVNAQMHYVALPVLREGRVAGAVRAAVEATSVNTAMRGMYVRVAEGAVVTALLAALLSLILARRLDRSLQGIRRGAERFAHGELHARLPEADIDELAALTSSMNQMAMQLDERIRAIVNQREEQEAVLTGMVEGVLAVDLEERVIIANQAAAKMFDFDAENAKGRFFQEVVRHTDVQQYIKRSLKPKVAPEHQMIFLDRDDQVVQAYASAIRDPQQRLRGTVVVFNDITRMRKLEMTRREFVANVSHELKTPITSIKGYVETIRESAPLSQEETDRFLSIIARQADQLSAIVDDLLDLARIEREAETDHVTKELAAILDILKNARQICEHSAQERGVQMTIACDDNLTGMVNARLLEQAVVNLLDNAIKYGKVGGTIHVEAACDNGELRISVRDDGPGIAAEHVPRIFERFYRVDRSRSREFGGTGLGLAIVKHIALAHRGSVDVDSAPGKGSTFIMRIPSREQPEA